ncbi:multidrug ABC transporter permease/ATP-binding protein [Vitreoscilla massiliensis]|uniref:Multidrug ABC transporter permease/ATP-binding protein n=1 Tax=Vitreoscilla massiliensis TaxID=1689272 RepID=A0ABY4E066_9NEIS|nr:multidrug ABC transporter permease/ATP-binding protein [Vitreoscilla massiliensis]UOO88723.1 multidrug ABC transporter permease/ATP-binding protein [Vitreoscilla massiliensis]
MNFTQTLSFALQRYRGSIVIMLLLSLCSSVMGVAVLAFINTRLLQADASYAHAIAWFVGLLVLYLLLATAAQMALTRLGHQLVYDLLTCLLKQIMDSDLRHIQALGKGKIMASLSGDIQAISYMFVRMPELLQGGLFIAAASAYLLYLSPSLFAVTLLWMAATLLGGYITVKHVYRHLGQMRLQENDLFQQYEAALDGHKELSLNRHRAQRFYQEVFTPTARKRRHHVIWADNFHALAGNWTNVMMLGAVGFIFYLAYYQHWASVADATTIAITVLFIRTPLLAAVGAYPTVLQGKVALQALSDLQLPEPSAHFLQAASLPQDWQHIHLHQVTYAYDGDGDASKATASFALAPLDFSLQRGETVFLVGQNGSGKSTLSLLLSGLYLPASGHISVDDTIIDASNRSAYRQYFSSVFTDVHLFSHLLSGDGELADADLVNAWLQHLRLHSKTDIVNGHIQNTALSQGQKKRLGLLIAAVEQRPVLVLDEWAADQDPHFRKVFYEQLLPILKQQGHTIFAISHDDKYFHHADRIIQMQAGKLTDYDPASAQTSF